MWRASNRRALCHCCPPLHALPFQNSQIPILPAKTDFLSIGLTRMTVRDGIGSGSVPSQSRLGESLRHTALYCCTDICFHGEHSILLYRYLFSWWTLYTAVQISVFMVNTLYCCTDICFQRQSCWRATDQNDHQHGIRVKRMQSVPPPKHS